MINLLWPGYKATVIVTAYVHFGNSCDNLIANNLE